MLRKLFSVLGVVLATTTPGLAQTAPTGAAGTTPATAMQAPAVEGTVTPPPGVSDPMATNSTTGTVDHEDQCQPPGTPTNTNPSADMVTIPRANPACN